MKTTHLLPIECLMLVGGLAMGATAGVPQLRAVHDVRVHRPTAVLNAVSPQRYTTAVRLSTKGGAEAQGRSASGTSEESQVDGILSEVVDQLWSKTDEYFHLGDYPRICDLDRTIVELDPHFVECFATGGYLMESLGRNSDAEAFYQQGIRNNPDNSYAYYSLGMFYFNTLKDYNAAVAIFRDDSATPDASDLDYKMLAHSYERKGQLDKALATWEIIQQRWPKSPALVVNMNRVRAKLAAAGSKSSGQ